VSEPLDLRLAGPAAAAWLVAWQGRLLPVPWLLLLAAVSGLLALLALGRGRAVAAGVLLCAAASALSTGARVHARSTGPVADAADRAAAVSVTGTLVDDPRVVPAKGDVLAFRGVVVATLRVTSLTTGGRAFHVRQPVLVLGDDSWLGLLPSQRVRAEGRLQAPDRGDAVAAVLSVRGRPRVLSGPSWLQAAAGRLREGMRDAASGLPHDERGLLPGLVDGDTSRLDPRLQDDFRRTGMTHMVAVSGDNVDQPHVS
jgi:competence protein ComEC